MTKKDKTLKCREILAKYKDLEFLQGLDKVFMLEILSNHPFFNFKKGSGIDEIFISTEKPYLVRGFWLRRTNGTVTEISYLEAISGKTTAEQIFKMTLREATIGEKAKFKLLYLKNIKGNIPICSYCSKHLNPDEMFIKENMKIREVIRRFIIEFDLKDFEQLTEPDASKLTGYKINDLSLVDDWIYFYERLETFKVLCEKCNMDLFR